MNVTLPLVPVAAPAPVVHDNGWSSAAGAPAVGPMAHDHGWANDGAGIQQAVKPAPFIVHDHNWYDQVYGIRPSQQDDASLRTRFAN